MAWLDAARQGWSLRGTAGQVPARQGVARQGKGITHKREGEMSQTINLYPAWRQAVKAFLEQGFQADDVIAFDWLYENFGLEKINPDTPYEEAQKTQLQFLASFKKFEEELLTEHQIALDTERGIGYKIVPSEKQSRWAFEKGLAEYKKVTRKAQSRLTNVDLVKLSTEERKENADLMARLAQLKVVTRQSEAVGELKKLVSKEIAS